MGMNLIHRLRRSLQTQYSPMSPGEPPFVRGVVPFLGCAVAYGKDAGAFLSRLRARHGDVFTVFLAGRRMTFVLDPREYSTVLLDSRLDFHEIAKEISVRVFRHTAESARQIDLGAVNRLTTDTLKGPDLDGMTRRIQEQLEARIFDDGAPAVDGLHAYIARLVFAAGCDSIFGEGFATEALFRHFTAFDRGFPLLAAGVPARLIPGVEGARAAIAERLAGSYARPSPLHEGREAMLRGAIDDTDRHAIAVGLVWTAVTNTIPAAFWSIFHIARDPAVKAAIDAEVREVAATAATDPRSGRPIFDRPALARMIRLDSAIDEALRLTSGSLLLRLARDPTELVLRNGRRVPLRAGDLVAIYPYLTHHDPELYEDPRRYQADRFLEEGRPKRTFMYRGERLRHHLLPFGAGVSVCPGRHFARTEIKLVVALLLGALEIEVLDSEVPPLDQSRAGLGILPPIRDVPLRLTRRRP